MSTTSGCSRTSSGSGWRCSKRGVSEAEAETALHLPGGAALAPDHHTGAGIHAHGGVVEVEAGVVEPQLDQSAVVGIAVDADAVGVPGVGGGNGRMRW